MQASREKGKISAKHEFPPPLFRNAFYNGAIVKTNCKQRKKPNFYAHVQEEKGPKNLQKISRTRKYGATNPLPLFLSPPCSEYLARRGAD